MNHLSKIPDIPRTSFTPAIPTANDIALFLLTSRREMPELPLQEEDEMDDQYYSPTSD